MPTSLGANLGREFFGGLKPWKKARPKISRSNPLPKFADKFAGNFPKIRWAKLKNSPQIRSAEPRDQNGQRTEQVKTGQVNPDRPLVGPSVDTFVGESSKG